MKAGAMLVVTEWGIWGNSRVSLYAQLNQNFVSTMCMKMSADGTDFYLFV